MLNLRFTQVVYTIPLSALLCVCVCVCGLKPIELCIWVDDWSCVTASCALSYYLRFALTHVDIMSCAYDIHISCVVSRQWMDA